MSGLFASLKSTATSIQAHSASVELAGRNIARMNDPTYARQRIVAGNMGTIQTQQGPQSTGYAVLGFEHVRDALLDTQLLAEISHEKGLEAGIFRLRQALSSMGEYLDRANDAQFIDDVAATGGGMRASISAFFNAFETFAARPNDPTVKQILLQKASSLTEEFNRIDGRLSNLHDVLDQQVSSEVDRVNEYLNAINNVNHEIAKIEIGRPGSALDLRDSRQALLEKLSAHVRIEAVEEPESQGQLTVFTRDSNGATVPLVGPALDVATIAVDSGGQLILADSPSVALDFQIGSLPAIIQLRDGAISDLRSQIDTLAEAIVTQVNTLYAPDVGDNNFFDASGTTAGSFRVDDTLTFETLISSKSGFSGANDIAQAIADLASQPITELGNATFLQFSSRLVTDLAQDIQDRENRHLIQASVRELVQARRDEISGVSLDEEVSQLLVFQRAFQASSRVFNVIDDMIDVMINNMGR